MSSDIQDPPTDLTRDKDKSSDKESNGAAAAILAAGIGCLGMGVITTLSEAVKPVADRLNLYNPVGPLSGKSLFASLVWLVTWTLLSRRAKAGAINQKRWLVSAFVCAGLAIVFTFPPFFDLFGDK